MILIFLEKTMDMCTTLFIKFQKKKNTSHTIVQTCMLAFCHACSKSPERASIQGFYFHLIFLGFYLLGQHDRNYRSSL